MSPKGTAITREAVELREAPSDGSLSNAFHTLDDAVGLIAQVGIGAHDVLMSGMAVRPPLCRRAIRVSKCVWQVWPAV